MKVLSALVFAFLITNGHSPNIVAKAPLATFEGTITYSIEYIKMPDEVAGMESMLPQETIMTLKGEMVRVEQNVMGGKQIVIANTATSESHVLMDMMGQKIDIYVTSEEANAEAEDMVEPEINELSGEKTILGYKCKKAEVVTEGGESRQTIYYTRKLKIKHNSFKTLDGFPLEFITVQNNMTLKMTASKIEKKKVSDDTFEVPEGYETMTMAELSEMMGGN